MKTRALHRLTAALLVGLFSVPAIAQYTRDASATKKIDEAVNNHYLMMELDKAESLLTGTVTACEDKCSPATKAKAWMYVGIVRGSGKADQAGAAEAFATAKGLDPTVKLDEALATPETKTTFDGTAGAAGAAPPPVAEPPPAAAAASTLVVGPPPAGVPGDMRCGPQGGDIQTGMPIPLSCTSDAAVAEGFVKFQEPGATDWKKVDLINIDGMWQAEIPCKFTMTAGSFKFYVGVKDANGEFVDQFGSKKAPASLTLAEQGAAPAFPGQPPVTRCAAATGGASDCPPDFPGCESSASTKQCGDLDWGAACNNSSQCQCGLLCEEGQCATAPTCTTNEECSTGSCVDGYCSALAGEGGGKDDGPFKRHWLSLNFGMDLMPYGGQNLCDANEGYEESYGLRCFDSEGNRYYRDLGVAGTADDEPPVDVSSGFSPGQLRIKLGYDFAFTPKLLAGIKAGFAFLNTRPNEEGQNTFLPVHVEVRGEYNFISIAKAGIRPALYVGGGMAESDGKLVAGDKEIYKLAGNGFGALGGKFGYYFAPHMGINADVQGMILFPSGGPTLVVHPSLNFTYGL